MNNNAKHLFARRPAHLDRLDLPVIEARLGAQLATGLSARTEALPRDISERLRVAREQAVRRARDVRKVAPVAAVDSGHALVGGDGAGLLGGFGMVSWWQRAASVLPILVLLAGLLLINQAAQREQVLAAAEIDSQLLADDLPPAAYSDPGFAEFLRSDATAAL